MKAGKAWCFSAARPALARGQCISALWLNTMGALPVCLVECGCLDRGRIHLYEQICPRVACVMGALPHREAERLRSMGIALYWTLARTTL